MYTPEDIERVREIELELQKLIPDSEITKLIGKDNLEGVRTLVKLRGNSKAIEQLKKDGWRQAGRKMKGAEGCFYIAMRKML